MISANTIFTVGCRSLYLLQLFIVLLAGGGSIHADAVNVIDQGARGDARKLLVITGSNSPSVTVLSTNEFTATDEGKVIMLYGVGTVTGVTTSQDFLGSILSVKDAKHITLSSPLGRSVSQARGIYGTENSHAFQRCVDRAYGTNTVIQIPKGNYLLIPKDLLNPDYIMKNGNETRAAVVINKGGIHFLGHDRKDTILTACGAWQLKGSHVSRGQLFECRGPIRNDDGLTFENLTMDGGLADGKQEHYGFPASVTDGSGWDLTHDGVMDTGTPPLHQYKSFKSCTFQHWRGEMLKSVTSWKHGFIDVENCDFHDGNASAFNYSFSHHINHCSFSNLGMAMEFYEGYMEGGAIFENSEISGVRGGLVICGALTNQVTPEYMIRKNTISSPDGFGILLGPAKNVVISGNGFSDLGFGIGTGAGYQGTDWNRDIRISFNSFNKVGTCFHVGSGLPNGLRDISLSHNSAADCRVCAGGYGYSTNVVLTDNQIKGDGLGIDGERLLGQWFLDDPSNQFPPHQIRDSSGTTTTISYASGSRQQTFSSKPDIAFHLDDSKPGKIPEGAKLVITHQGPSFARLFLSNVNPNPQASQMMKPGAVITCEWGHGLWQVVNSHDY